MVLRARNGFGALLSLFLLCTAPLARAELDRVEFLADFGVGYDLTNQIYSQQSFDSTLFSRTETVSDPETRLQGVGDVRFGLYYDRNSRLRVENRLSAGEKLIRNNLYLDWRHELGGGWRWITTSDLGYREDRSFDSEQLDIRESARLGFEYRTPELTTSWRMNYRFDLGKTNSGPGLLFYPDYQFHRIVLGVDRFHFSGTEWGLNYSLGYRAFPDTTERNYLDHLGEARFRTRFGRGATFELRGLLNRRAAVEAASLGDRFLSGDAEAMFRYPMGGGPSWSVGGRAAFYGTAYDVPDPVYFHTAVPRAELFVRYEQFPSWSVVPRFQFELLRVPNNGGLGDPGVSGDALGARREEYDQLNARLDLERLGERIWFFVSPAVGRRTYRLASSVQDDLLARSGYWFAQVNSFAELRVGPFWKMRVSLDLLHERHDVSSDDLTSLLFASEVRYALFR